MGVKQANLLVELRFGGLGYRQTLRAYEFLRPCFREELASRDIGIGKLEVFFSKRRIVLWLRLHTGGDRIEAKAVLTRAVSALLQRFGRAQPETWALASGMLALIEDEVLPLATGGLVAGRQTQAGEKVLSIQDTQHYWREMARLRVYVDNNQREKRIRQLLAGIAADLGAEIVSSQIIDEAVLDCEEPQAGWADISPDLLDLPEILILIILEELHCFALRLPGDKLLAKAAYVCNRGCPPPDLNGELVRARDIYRRDLERTLAQRLEDLGSSCYLGKLGSYLDKQGRLQKIALSIANQAEAGRDICDLARQSAQLAKLDVTAEICGIYPEFLGHMGAVIARREGASDTVASAIIEHWHPSRYSRKLPRTLVGALLGVADRLDNICGQYYRGELKLSQYRNVVDWFDETIAIVASVPLDLSMTSLLKFSLSLYESQGLVPWRARDLDYLLKIFGDRLHYHLEGLFPLEAAAVVTAPGADNVYAAVLKAEALGDSALQDCLADCAEACKMLDRTCPRDYNYEEAAREYLELPEESDLFEVYLATGEEVKKHLQHRRMGEAVTRLAKVRTPLLRFINSVDLDTPDRPLRLNRLSLLGEIRQLYFSYGDFSLL
jgi:glycyl-tRNA synthetase beta chain